MTVLLRAGYPYIHSSRGKISITAGYCAATAPLLILSMIAYPLSAPIFFCSGLIGAAGGKILIAGVLKKNFFDNLGYLILQVLTFLLLTQPTAPLSLPFCAGLFTAIFSELTGGVRALPLNPQMSFMVIAAMLFPDSVPGLKEAPTQWLWNSEAPIFLLTSPVAVWFSAAILCVLPPFKKTLIFLFAVLFCLIGGKVFGGSIAELTSGLFIGGIILNTDWASMPSLNKPRHFYFAAAGTIMGILIHEPLVFWAAAIVCLNAMTPWADQLLARAAGKTKR